MQGLLSLLPSISSNATSTNNKSLLWCPFMTWLLPNCVLLLPPAPDAAAVVDKCDLNAK